jgi:hypothetical protein
MVYNYMLIMGVLCFPVCVFGFSISSGNAMCAQSYAWKTCICTIRL